MPISRNLVVALFVLISLTLIRPAHADSIVILASASSTAHSGQTNSNGANITIAKNSRWADTLRGSAWVSYTTMGNTSASGFVTVANGRVVSFFDSFNLAGPATSVAVMVDDSASVLLNWVVLIGETVAKNTHASCSDFGVGCLQPTVLDLPVSLLHSGTNTLEFQVAQRNGGSFGLDFLESIADASPVTTPEAATGALLALGLGALGLIGFERRYDRSKG